jgi:hypothetical protein
MSRIHAEITDGEAVLARIEIPAAPQHVLRALTTARMCRLVRHCGCEGATPGRRETTVTYSLHAMAGGTLLTVRRDGSGAPIPQAEGLSQGGEQRLLGLLDAHLRDAQGTGVF